MPELTPPTPAVSLSTLLARADLGLRQVAGPPADQVDVHWVHTSEMDDPVPYLLGGELLLTAGVHFGALDGSAEYLDHYVSRTVEAGAAALGFGLAPVHDTTPAALVDACERHGLPLVEVPPQTTFTAIARAVWQSMAEARHRELRRVTEAQQGLAAAAARPGPVPAVLRQLAHHLGARAALVNPRGEELYGAGPEVPPQVGTAMKALAAVVRPDRPGAPASAADTAAGTRLAAYALAGGAPGEGLVLVIAAPRRDPADHAIAGVAAVLLTLLTGPYHGAPDQSRTSALVRLLLGAPAPAVEPLLTGTGDPARDAPGAGGAPGAGSPAAGAAGRPAPADATRTDARAAGPAASATASVAGPAATGTWVVVHGRRRGGAERGGVVADTLAAAALGAVLGTALVDTVNGALRALLPPGRDVGPIAAKPGWTLGVSAPVPVGELAAADAQAAAALRRAVANRAAIAHQHAPGTGIAGLLAPGEAHAYARTRLAPIADSAALTDTLRTWISLHGSWDRTAVALEVHRNTVRQRIARAAALLGVDLDDPDVRADLWIALRHL